MTQCDKELPSLIEEGTVSTALLEMPGLYILLWVQDTPCEAYVSEVELTEFQAQNELMHQLPISPF